MADMERVAKATGARTQTTVNGLTAESAKSFLGTCKRFEEKQVSRLFLLYNCWWDPHMSFLDRLVRSVTTC